VSSHVVHRILSKFYRAIQAGNRTSVAAGFIDPHAFDERVAYYRSIGASIGEHVRLIGTIDGINPHLVSIGDYSVLGLQSALLAHCPINGGLPCRVGKYVYIAFNVSVLPGVTIGNHCVIGAGSVVTKDIPQGSIAAGNPARVLRKLTETEKQQIVSTMEEHRMFGYKPPEVIA
jgi:acetyltransferase-like isoleucine patch superfamily enzyme